MTYARRRRQMLEPVGGPPSPLTIVVFLERQAEDPDLATRPGFTEVMLAAAALVRQHLPINRQALAQVALSDDAIRALATKAGLSVSKPENIAKVRALLLAAGEGA